MTAKKPSQTELYGELLSSEQAYRKAIYDCVGEHDPTQKYELVELARGGEKQDRDRLLFYFLPYLTNFARRCVRDFDTTLEYTDLVQEGCLAILSSMDKALSLELERVVAYLFDGAFYAIRQAIQRHRSLIVTPSNAECVPLLSMEAPLPETEGFTIGDLVEDGHFSVVVSQRTNDHTALHDAIRQLKENERAVVVRHYGMYINAPEPVNEIAPTLGIAERSARSLLHKTLAQLGISLQPAYPQYDYLTRETQRHTTVSYKPLTPQQQSQLQEAHSRLLACGLVVNVQSLAREAHIHKAKAALYFKSLPEQGRPPTLQERLDRAVTEMQAQGKKVTPDALARMVHTIRQVAQAYLDTRPDVYVPEPSVEERLQEAYTQLLASREKVTVTRLVQMAHVRSTSVCAFLRRMRGDQSVAA